MTELSELATKHHTDKWNHHWYTDHYYKHLHHFKPSSIKLLEIGVGGYDTVRGGGSLRMWKEFFQYGEIWSIDIYDKAHLQEERIKILQGSQADPAFLQILFEMMGNIHVVIDDGSHQCAHQITSFLYLFPKLDTNGIYIIEDTESSYWEDHGGSQDLSDPKTTVNFFRDLVHGMNHVCIANYPVQDLNRMIKSITFYKNLIIIEKGENK